VLHRAVVRILDAQAGWADPLGKIFVSVFRALYKPVPAVKDFLHGVWLGHPLHPALTDVPVGAFLIALVLDVIGTPVGAAAAIGVGIVFMVLAALAGYADYLDLEGRALRQGTVHSSLMLVAVVLYIASFLMRVGSLGTPGASAGGVEIWLSVIGFAIVTVAAYIGGELVFNTGSQVDRHAWRGGGTKWSAVEVGEIAENVLVKARAGTQTIVIVRQGDQLHALHDICAHQGCNLSEGGKIVGDAIECACHGSRYRLRDGLVVRGPAVFDQPHYEVRKADGRLEARRTDTR
jgi:nitrite reductase/ring-hydroxylating ferredoxin subunit/uncharacterized membrane protein